MNKKFLEIIGVFLLICFSFYYTDKAVNLVKNKDPLMKEIKEQATYFEVEPINATIYEDVMIPGINGKKVDIMSSFDKMKRLGKFNESLLVFDEITPTITIKNTYDKYINQGNNLNKEVSLIIPVSKNDNIDSIIEVLKVKQIPATFFIDGVFLEENLSVVKELADDNYDIAILSYDQKTDEEKFLIAINKLETYLNKNVNYCYSDYKDDLLLKTCGERHKYTIVPSILTANYPYQEVKNNLQNGSIISFNNLDKIDEIKTVINYVKQKGYSFLKLEDLLSEEK